MSRLMLGCGEVKHAALEWWSSLRRRAREQEIGKRLRQTMERLVDVTETAGSHAILRVRNTLERLNGRGEVREAEDAAMLLRETLASKPSLSSEISSPYHQSLQVISKPINYLEKCMNNNASASGGSTRPTTSTPRRERNGKKAWTGRNGNEERGSEVGLTGGAENGLNGIAGGTLIIPKPPFTAKELHHYLIRAIHSRDLNDQLKTVPLNDETRSKSVASLPCNKQKNRYRNNLPYDDTRVVLVGGAAGDYINASYISCSLCKNRFIAAQGPKGANERTVEDFWLMVWQNNTNVIVMVANLVEGGREKVGQYWPDAPGRSEDYRMVKVLMKTESKHVDYIVRHFLVSMDTRSRHVVQYQYVAWPDHLVPANPVGAALMISNICQWRWTGPPVIHCSAGLGRSGTILLVLLLLDNLRTEGLFHAPDALLTLRMCRPNLLDNQLQYRFAHQVLLEVLFGGKTRCLVDKLPIRDPAFSKHLHRQFQELKSFPTGLTYDWARTNDPSLNRDNSVLPADGRQVLLMAPEGDAIGQYVNAVRVRGGNLQEAFLVTEHPMAHTVGRAWRLAYAAKATAWVFLHDHSNLPDEEDFPSVLPCGGSGEVEGITVHVDGEVEKRFYTETSITVSQQALHTMHVIHFKHWRPSKELPDRVESLFALVQRLEELQRAWPYRLIMVSCSDGYSASGVLVTLARLIVEVRLTQSVDVFRCVMSVLFDRPQFIKSKSQYFYLHDAVLAYHQARKRRQVQAGGQKMKEDVGREKKGDVHEARKSKRKSDNGLPMLTKISLKNNDREIYDNKEGRKERKEVGSHISRESRTEMDEKEREMADNTEREGRRNDETREANSRTREDERMKSNTGHNFEEKERIRGKQRKTAKGKEAQGDLKEESHYEHVWFGEVKKKAESYEKIWESKEGQQTGN